MKKKNNNKNNYINNFFLFLTVGVAIANFIIAIINNKDLVINITSSLLLAVFTCFYVLTSITNKSKSKSSNILASLFLIGILSFQISNNLGFLNKFRVDEIPNFTNKSLIEVIKWSEKNNYKVNQIYEYSDTINEYKIINQKVKNSKKGKEITVSVSEGANPLKEIVIPDMTTWDADRVLTYIKKNYLNNVLVEFTTSDKEKDTVIEQSKSGSIKRNDEIKLIFSLGEEVNDKVKLIDLRNKSSFEAQFFLKRNALNFEIEKKFSNKISRNKVITTDKKIGTLLRTNNDEDKVKLIVSKGKKIKVPDLNKMKSIDITEWIINNKLKLKISSKYDDTIKKNKVISTNYKSGDMIEEKTLVEVIISKGKLAMDKFNSLEEFKIWAEKYEVNYEEKYEFSNEVEKGKIISFSHKMGDTIKNDDIVVVTISSGEKVKVPDLVGLTKESAVKKLENAKLKYNFVYDYSSKEKNIVIKQSLNSGSEVGEKSTITITLSNGKKQEEKKSSSSNNNNNSDNISGKAPESKQEECDKSKKITVTFQSSLNGNSLSETATNYKNAYPGVKFNFVGKSSDIGNNGMVHKDSSSKRFFEANYCDTYTIYIINN